MVEKVLDYVGKRSESDGRAAKIHRDRWAMHRCMQNIQDAHAIKEHLIDQEEVADEPIAQQTQLMEGIRMNIHDELVRSKTVRAEELKTEAWEDDEKWRCNWCAWIQGKDGLENVVNQRLRPTCYTCGKRRQDPKKEPERTWE